MNDRLTKRVLTFGLMALLTGAGVGQAYGAAPAVKQDSTAAAARTAPLKPGNEELILDENDNSLVPSAKTATTATTPAISAESKTPLSGTAGAAVDSTAPKTSAPIKAAAVPDSSIKSGAESAKQPAGTPAATMDTTKKTSDEELILEGGEEDLLDKAKIAQKQAEATKKAAALAHQDSARAVTAPGASKPAQALSPSVPAAPGDTAGKAPANSVTNAPLPTAGSLTIPSVDQTATPSIGNVSSINFARNLKDYRSPKLAMLMSLLLPGSGQIYAKSGIWAAGFGIAEVALIATGVSFASKANKYKTQGQTFADNHYSVKRFQNYRDSLQKYLQNHSPNPHIGDSLLDSIIFAGRPDTTFASQALARDAGYYSTLNNTALSSTPLIRGWDDVRPDTLSFTSEGFQNYDTSRYAVSGINDTIVGINANYLIGPKSDPTKSNFGTSENQRNYTGLMTKSLNWSNNSRYAFLSLLVNHIASAVMAGILAKRQNDELLGRESFWQHLDVQMKYVNTGSESVPSYALGVGF